MRVIVVCGNMFSKHCFTSIVTRLCSRLRTNKMIWIIIKAIHVSPLLSAIQNVYGVCTKNMENYKNVKIIRNK